FFTVDEGAGVAARIADDGVARARKVKVTHVILRAVDAIVAWRVNGKVGHVTLVDGGVAGDVLACGHGDVLAIAVVDTDLFSTDLVNQTIAVLVDAGRKANL